MSKTDIDHHRTHRKPLQVLPLDTAPRLVLVPLHGCHSRRSGLRCLQHRCMCRYYWYEGGRRLTGQGKYQFRGKRREDTIAEF